MNKIVCMILLFICALETKAASLDEWTFESDPAGRTLSEALNSGSAGSVFSPGGAEFLETDGYGKLLCTHTGEGADRIWIGGALLNADVPDASSGVRYVRCDLRYDLSSGDHSDGAVLGLTVRDNSGTNFIGMAVACDWEDDGAMFAAHNITPVAENLHTAGHISYIMKVNMDTRTMDVWFDLTGSNQFDEDAPAVTNCTIQLNSIDELQLQATGDFRPEGSSNYAAIENIRTAETWEDIVLAHEVPVTVHTLFHDHMVLQRDMAVPVWGHGTPGATVIIQLDGVTVGTALVDAGGEWIVKITPNAHDGGQPHVMRISYPGRDGIEITDVVFGDVFIAAGQSNMAMRMNGSVIGYAEELAVADENSLIRQIAIAATNSLAEQESPLISTPWTRCGASTLGNFSATGYFFAKNIYAETGVPIGLLFSAWGGQKIDRFLSPSGVTAVPELSGMQQYQEEGRIANVYDIYNVMIAPLIPYGIKGAIWYQGEANIADGHTYKYKMQALMRGWRQEWGQGDFPFYYVQLANYTVTSDWAGLREAQTVALSETNSGMAVTIDIGNDADIHPLNKLDVGKRLAQWALAGDPDSNQIYSGPLYHQAAIEGSRIRILFDHAESGLVIGWMNGTNFVLEADGPLQNFEIAGADKIFAAAEAVIDNDTVLVSSTSVSNPLYVRYCYSSAPAGANKLYNAAKLPASPFRTDESYKLDVKAGTGTAAGLVPDARVAISASAPPPDKVFDRWIGAAAEVANLNAASTTVTMPARSLYLIATYRNTAMPFCTLTVNNGFGSGTSQAGSILNIEANAPSAGQAFDHWVGDTQSVINVKAFSTTLRMPTNSVSVAAVYRTVDSAGDGTADIWRAAYFGGDGAATNSDSAASADPDEDSMSNIQEYHAGTSPIDAQSVLQLEGTISDSNTIVNFSSVAGHRYRLETTAILTRPVWTPVLYNIAGDGTLKHINLNTSATSNAFYRLRLNTE